MGMFSSIILRSKLGASRMEDRDKVTMDEFTKMLKKGIVKFVYLKKDGYTVRTAYGTKDMEDPEVVPVHGGPCPPKDYAGYTTYFDCQQMGWRVFHDGFLLRIESVHAMDWDEFKREEAEDDRTGRAKKDAEESLKYKSQPFSERPFYWKKCFEYPDVWEDEKKTKKSKKTAGTTPATDAQPGVNDAPAGEQPAAPEA